MEARGITYKRLIGVSCSHLPESCVIQIEKDVKRSGLSLDDGSGAPAALRRMLLALAALDPATNYCQSMNSVGALCLLVVRNEEKAFWLFSVICRGYQPAGYYAGLLSGARRDVGVLGALIKACVRGNLSLTHSRVTIACPHA